jgi:NAD(P)-dependent dehydrogenase (short-subunit alcohol dehydrogenase family)
MISYYRKMYSKKMAYMASKLMQVVSTIDLNSRLEKEGVNVRVYAVHPGVVKTDLHKISLSVICFMYTLGWLYKVIQ